jgi:hypothetical protein
MLISPLPGTYGAPTRKKNHITVYSPSLHLFCYVPFHPDSTIQDIKYQLQLKLSHPLAMHLLQRDIELQDCQCLSFYHITERSLLKVEFVDEPSSLEMESGGKWEQSGISGGSIAVGSTKQDSSSMSASRPWEIDFSIYALPDAELSVRPIKQGRKRKGPIPEEDACKLTTRT